MNLPLPMLLLELHGRLGRIRILSIDRILLEALVVGLRVLDLVSGGLCIPMDLVLLVSGYLSVYIQEEAMRIKRRDSLSCFTRWSIWTESSHISTTKYPPHMSP